mmetsp:Transcript_18260/g.28357  ORF Transcript_18260/g.28357 Transcript_18260/m.28357 type:complete len:80 (-) Transcript_18260:2424-2663(-)
MITFYKRHQIEQGEKSTATKLLYLNRLENHFGIRAPQFGIIRLVPLPSNPSSTVARAAGTFAGIPLLEMRIPFGRSLGL